MSTRLSLRTAALLFLALLLTGTAGYMLIEGWSLLDAVYMTVTTLSTVGFGEIHPLHTAGRIFTIIYILIGVATTFYILSAVVVFVVEGQLGKSMGRRRM